MAVHGRHKFGEYQLVVIQKSIGWIYIYISTLIYSGIIIKSARSDLAGNGAMHARGRGGGRKYSFI